MTSALRVLDLGTVSVPRSQAVYHGVASVMGDDDLPVLTLASPEKPYVCIGLHQDLEAEVDQAYCRSAGLPVLRRHVGGGAVYLDRDQLFFHFIYPRAEAPGRVADIYQRFAAPVVATYQSLGIAARLRPINDIHVEGRKIGGMGAAQIGDATVLVGSFMFDFDVATMARCLKVPSEKFRDKLHSTLTDYITTIRRELGRTLPREEVIATFRREIAARLDVQPQSDGLRPREEAAVVDWERQLLDPEWLEQPGRRRFAEGVKITGGVSLGEGVHKAAGGLIRARLLSRDGHIADLDISGDFTCIPASGVSELCRRLRGEDLAGDLAAAIGGYLQQLDLDLPGVTAQDLAAGITAAFKPAD